MSLDDSAVERVEMGIGESVFHYFVIRGLLPTVRCRFLVVLWRSEVLVVVFPVPSHAIMFVLMAWILEFLACPCIHYKGCIIELRSAILFVLCEAYVSMS